MRARAASDVERLVADALDQVLAELGGAEIVDPVRAVCWGALAYIRDHEPYTIDPGYRVGPNGEVVH